MLKIAQTAPLSEYLDSTFTRPDLDHLSHTKPHKEVEDLVKDRVETVYHPTTTCKMAVSDEDGELGGVVDSKLRVFGIRGLRICDASVFPKIPSGHTVRSSTSRRRWLSLMVWFRPALVLQSLRSSRMS
jgi:choline dehydrogenase